MKYISGAIYDGEWKLDMKHGTGTFDDKNGNLFKGYWANNKKDGKGKITYTNGDIYEGDCSKDNI